MFDKKSSCRPRARPCRGAPSACRCPRRHFVNGAPLEPPFPPGTERALFGMGCFWGAERKFWQTPGVSPPRSATPAATRRTRPTARSAAGQTGHTEVVLVVFDPTQVTLRASC